MKTKDGKRDEWHEATVIPAVQALQEERKMLSQRKQSNKVDLSMKLQHDREEEVQKRSQRYDTMRQKA